MADFLRPREDIGDRISVKSSPSENLPRITCCPQEKGIIQIRIEWSFNFTLNPASGTETAQWMMSYCPRGFWSLNSVLRTADSLDMRHLPLVYILYAALSIDAHPSIFGSALGPQIYFLSRRPVYRSSNRGQSYVNGQPFVSDDDTQDFLMFWLMQTLNRRWRSIFGRSVTMPSIEVHFTVWAAPVILACISEAAADLGQKIGQDASLHSELVIFMGSECLIRMEAQLNPWWQQQSDHIAQLPNEDVPMLDNEHHELDWKADSANKAKGASRQEYQQCSNGLTSDLLPFRLGQSTISFRRVDSADVKPGQDAGHTVAHKRW
jgi:hypothetical protein